MSFGVFSGAPSPLPTHPPHALFSPATTASPLRGSLSCSACPLGSQSLEGYAGCVPCSDSTQCPAGYDGTLCSGHGQCVAGGWWVPRMPLPRVDTICSGTSGAVSVLVDIALPRGNMTAGDFTSSFPVTAPFAAGQAQVNVSVTLSPGAVEGL